MGKRHLVCLAIGTLVAIVTYFSSRGEKPLKEHEKILHYVLNPAEQELEFFWKARDGALYSNFERLKNDLHKADRELVFAMNGGMFLKDQSPQGLYIEKGEIYKELDRKQEAYGNFYLQPNGVFYLNQDNQAEIVKTSSFKHSKEITYATQSGPMLVIEGAIHPAFREGSDNLHIRNGVGVLEDGNLLFAMSKERINFFDFASFFKERACQNALYLDGFVSRTYLPQKGYKQTDGSFGVIIAETRKKGQ